MTTEADSFVLRVVVPRAFLEPKLPLFDFEGKMSDDKVDKMPDDKVDKMPDDKVDKMPDDKVDKMPDDKVDKMPDDKVDKLKQTHNQYALATDIRIGLVVKYCADREICNKEKIGDLKKHLPNYDDYQNNNFQSNGSKKSCPQNIVAVPKYNTSNQNNNFLFSGCCSQNTYLSNKAPPTKYGLTYFPNNYRFEFKDVKITEESHLHFAFFAMDTNNHWLICSGTTDNDTEENNDEEANFTKENSNIKFIDWLRKKITLKSEVKDDEYELRNWYIPLDREKSIIEEECESCKTNKSTNESTNECYFCLLKTLKQPSEKGKPVNEKGNGWAKISISLLTKKQAELRKWNEDKNEYPVLPDHGIEDVVITDFCIKNQRNGTIESMLQFWTDRDKDIKIEVERFILRQCRPNEFGDILMKCLKVSDDPIATALRASEICEDRKTRKNSSGIDWDMEKKKAEACAVRLAELIPNQIKKLHMVSYYSEAGKLILDENLDLAIENGYKEVCAHPVFMERIKNRWLHTDYDKRRKRGMSPLEKVSPCVWFILQAFFYLFYLGLLSYSTASYGGIYKLSYRESLSTIYFDENYNNIKDFDTFWNWINNTLITNALPDNIDDRLATHEWLATPEIALRQYRVLPTENCYLFTHYNMSCYPSVDVADQLGLLVGFGKSESLRNETWQGTHWLDESHIVTDLPIKGLHYYYYPGGYLALLKGNKSSAVDMVANLSEWLDEQTRAVFVEFALYNLDGNYYSMFQILVEFTHVGAASTMTGLTIIDHRALNAANGDWAVLLMFIFTLGFILQELAEMFVVCVNQYKDLTKKYKRTPRISNPIHQNLSSTEIYKNLFRNRFPLVKALIATIIEHFTDIWNIIDAINNSAMFIYVIIYCLTSVSSSPYRVADPTDVSMAHLWNLEYLIEMSRIFGSIGVVFGYFRFLYFFIPLHAIGPLVLSMLWMYVDIMYFIGLLCIIIIGFAAGFNLLYGGIEPAFTGFGISIFTCLTVAYSQQFFVHNDEFVPMPIYWIGDIIMVAYFVLSAILLVNLLIAMMSATYNDLMGDNRPIEGEWSMNFGELLLHYERFLFLPPPLNLLQILGFCISALLCCFQSYEKYKWIIFGRWSSRDRVIYRLALQKYNQDRQKNPLIDSQKNPDSKDSKDSEYSKCKYNVRTEINKKEASIWKEVRNFIAMYEKKQKDAVEEKVTVFNRHEKIKQEEEKKIDPSKNIQTDGNGEKTEKFRGKRKSAESSKGDNIITKSTSKSEEKKREKFRGKGKSAESSKGDKKSDQLIEMIEKKSGDTISDSE